MWTTPSYAWALGETAVADGIDPRRDLAVRRIFVAGEPGGSIPETRARIEDLWGASVYDYYGLSDIFGSCAGMCEEKDGLHWAEDHILVEVLDPATLVPVAEGERGELVLTTLRKAARPMIRFRTGDIVSFTSAPCRCGRTSIRMHGVHGRLDDMLIIKGVNIFPSDVEALVRGDDRHTGEYRLVVDRFEHLDRLTVEPLARLGIRPRRLRTLPRRSGRSGHRRGRDRLRVPRGADYVRVTVALTVAAARRGRRTDHRVGHLSVLPDADNPAFAQGLEPFLPAEQSRGLG